MTSGPQPFHWRSRGQPVGPDPFTLPLAITIRYGKQG
jgi:hypothetical protein